MKKTWLIAVSLVSMVILLGIVGSVVLSPSCETPKSSSSVPGPQPSDNNSYAELLHFVERLMTYPGMPFRVATLPGELPGDLPVEVPIPNDAEIIGSSVRSVDPKYKHVEIIFDVPEEPNEVIEFYRNSLEKAGWNEQEGFYPSEEGGFAHIFSMPESATFCRYEREGPSLTITAYTPDGEKPADVRLDLDTDPRAPVCIERFGPRTDRDEEVIPLLKPPEGAIPRRSGSGGGGDQWESDATLETELSVRELDTHYRNQLLEAGWELKEEGSNSSIAWSIWSFTDEFGDDWSGLLLVSELGQENLRYLYLMVHMVY